MTDKLAKDIRQAGKEIEAFLRGDSSRVTVERIRIPEDIDVRSVRTKLALSQAEFAAAFGFKLSAVQSWERVKERRKPTLTARILLTALDRKPEAVLSALVEETA